MHLRNSKRNLEEQLEKTKEGYNALRRDINKAQSDSSMESQKSGDIKSIYIELKKQFEEYKNSMVERVKNLEEKLEEALEENDEIKGNLQLKSEIAERIDLERTKICRFEAKEQQVAADQDKRIEKIGRLIEENAILTEKLNESESFRKKFKEKNTFLDKQLKLALAEKEKIEGAYVQIKKRANDLSVLKTSNNKILDEKIKQLSKENEDLLSENKSLKNRLDRLGKVQQVEENDDEEDDLEEVTAKPFLFGPIDNGKF